MALRAEGAAALDCFEVTLKCEDGEDDEDAVVVAVIPRPEPMLRATQQEKTPPPRSSLLEAGIDGCEEPKQVSWEQEFLVGSSPGGSGRALCMVCGAEIKSPSADTARAHILEQHPHTLDLSPSEKSNILEAWSEGLALLQDIQDEQPTLPNLESGQDGHPDPSNSSPDPVRMPAEIVVLLDSEDNPSLPKRIRPRGLRPLELTATPVSEPANRKSRGQRWRESPEEEPVRKKKRRPVTKNLDPDPDPPSPESPTEEFAAPAEVRHFTDGSFPPGFVLQLFSHTQLRAPESKDSGKDSKVAGDLPQPESPSSAPPPGLRGTLDLQVIRVRMEEPPAVSLLQDWSKHPQGTKRVGAGDNPAWPAVLSESSATVRGQPEAGSEV